MGEVMREEEARKGLSIISKFQSIKKITDTISPEEIRKVQEIFYRYIPVLTNSEEKNP